MMTSQQGGGMDRTTFAALLLEAIQDSWVDFLEKNPEETPYGYALIGDGCGSSLMFAIATEEGLKRVASEYHEKGYRYQGWVSDESDNREKLAAWLRWANPDDGWYHGDFAERFAIQSSLAELVTNGALGEEAGDLEEFCVDVPALLRRSPIGQRWPDHVVVGFTYGEDPRDFLRTATRANPYTLVRQLWSESWRAEELGSQIRDPGQL